MKWLFLLLLAVNVILFIVQIKERDESSYVSNFNQVAGAQNIKLLKEDASNAHERCVVIGEITDTNVLDKVKLFLSGNDVKFELIEKETVLAPNYWVYVVDEIEDGLVNNLNAKGVDSYVVASGELKGKLSLGLFANIDLAQDMIKSMTKIGVNAAFFEKRKTQKTKWLSFRLAEIDDGVSIIKALKDMRINLGEIKEFFCKSIASEK
tara:strand:- start:85 stop:708 length:624 start_codon:yes stop_codon:yes gene_type:complete